MLAQTLSRHGDVVVVAPERTAAEPATPDAGSSADRAHRRQRLPLRQRHAHRLRAPRRHRPARLQAGHGVQRHQPRPQPRRRHALLRHRGRRDRRFHAGHPSVAVSLAGYSGQHFASAAVVVDQLVERCKRTPFREPVLLNVNVPDIAPEALGQLTVTRLGRRHCAQPVIKSQNPRGETIYWVDRSAMYRMPARARTSARWPTTIFR